MIKAFDSKYSPKTRHVEEHAQPQLIVFFVLYFILSLPPFVKKEKYIEEQNFKSVFSQKMKLKSISNYVHYTKYVILSIFVKFIFFFKKGYFVS